MELAVLVKPAFGSIFPGASICSGCHRQSDPIVFCQHSERMPPPRTSMSWDALGAGTAFAVPVAKITLSSTPASGAGRSIGREQPPVRARGRPADAPGAITARSGPLRRLPAQIGQRLGPAGRPVGVGALALPAGSGPGCPWAMRRAEQARRPYRTHSSGMLAARPPRNIARHYSVSVGIPSAGRSRPGQPGTVSVPAGSARSSRYRPDRERVAQGRQLPVQRRQHLGPVRARRSILQPKSPCEMVVRPSAGMCCGSHWISRSIAGIS